MTERVQKVIAAAGICSRRRAEELIKMGLVKINGETAVLGASADPEKDLIEVNGRQIRDRQDFVYIMLNKPAGVVATMSDEKGRKTVRDLTADARTRVYPVGRLDLNSAGLLLMTNDGDLAYKLMHPKYEIDKTYHVGVRGDVEKAMPILQGPMELDGKPLAPSKVRFMREMRDGSSELEFIIHEGRNRQVRRMCETAELEVIWLRRVSEGQLRLGDLEQGKWRYLTAQEIEYLKSI